MVFSVSTDAETSRIRPFLKKMNLSLPVYTIGAEDQAKLTLTSIPTTFLIGRDGRIVRSQNGYSGRFESDWGASIEQALGPVESGPTPARGGS